ncbi:DSBA oxidoreductase [Xenorhabdus kozodoii]|uniref:DSBA oxidoreductase n=1 Tax=Xenorhabdus kozodoii TaxID=351676 RepID=A0A2D0L871_9GAMM|nr:hypothetical protein [Xenorhabdus kozodoii]PHM71850.1 DSBA oxidoreductase [Xenorhabdus kozodoii]
MQKRSIQCRYILVAFQEQQVVGLIEQHRWTRDIQTYGKSRQCDTRPSLLATSHIQQRDSASSAVLINIFRSLGGSCGTAMLGTLFISYFNIHIYDIKISLLSSNRVFVYYLNSIKNMMINHGLETNFQNIKHTAIVIYQSPFKMRLISPRYAGRYKHSRWFASGNLKLDWYIGAEDSTTNPNYGF